jgi:hypothetical protein
MRNTQSAVVRYACKGEHTLFNDQREREGERGRERENEGEREREKQRVFIFKNNDGCLGTF